MPDTIGRLLALMQEALPCAIRLRLPLVEQLLRMAVVEAVDHAGDASGTHAAATHARATRARIYRPARIVDDLDALLVNLSESLKLTQAAKLTVVEEALRMALLDIADDIVAREAAGPSAAPCRLQNAIDLPPPGATNQPSRSRPRFRRPVAPTRSGDRAPADRGARAPR